MTFLSNGAVVTDIDAHAANLSLLRQGYAIRHLETWHAHDNQSFIHWDPPPLTEADLPY
jgi:hypothetical protein